MRTLRHHLLMEEDRRSTQGKERRSQHDELHLGEDKSSSKRNWQKRKYGTDLRDKINQKRDRNDYNGRISNQKVDKRKFNCHNCGEEGHFRSECTIRRGSQMIRSITTTSPSIRIIEGEILHLMVCHMFLYVQNLYLQLPCQIVGWLILAPPHTLQEIGILSVHLNQYKRELDLFI